MEERVDILIDCEWQIMKQMNRFSILTFTILLQSILTNAANDFSLNISTINEEKGLFTDDVRCVFQDSNLLLWVGTDEGLFTYDGYKSIQINARNKDNSIHNIGFTKVVTQHDSLHLLVGTYSGLYVYSKVEGVLRLVPQTQDLEVNAMAHDNHNQVWLGTYTGIYCYNAHVGVKRHKLLDSKGKEINDVKCLLFDSNKQLWIGTWSNGLFRYNPDSGEVVTFPKLGQKNSPHILFEDHRKRLIVGTWGDGVFYFDIHASNNSVRYQNIRLQSNEISYIPSNIIYTISQDNQYRYLWIGGRNGLCVLKDIDRPQSFIKELGTKSLNNYKLSGKDVNSIHVGKDNSMWLGILGGGINRISFPPFRFSTQRISTIEPQSNFNYPVNKIMPISAEKVWVSIPRNQVVEIDISNNQQSVIKNELEALAEEVDEISKYFQISEQEYIVNFASGLLCRILFSNEGKVLKSTTLSRNFGRIISFAKTPKGELYFATKWRVGIIYANNNIEYLPQSVHNEKKSILSISSIAVDSIGDLWISSVNNHLIRVRKNKKSPDCRIISSHNLMRGTVQVSGIYTLFIDSRNRLWVGTNGSGIFYYNLKENRFDSFDDRLRNVAETIFDIAEDQQGRYWINTNRELMSIEVNSQFQIVDLRTYDSTDGLPQEKVQRGSLALSSNGTLFCGHRNGFSYINTASIIHENTPLIPSIINIKVGNQSFEDFPLEEQWAMSAEGNPYYNQTITLNHNQNNIGIELGVVNHLKQNKVIFAYKLEGFNKEWTYVSSINRTIVFPLLESGQYKLLVKVSENNVEWSKEVALMNFAVLPPWWNTWLAKLIYGVLALVVGYVVICTIRNRTKLDKEVKRKELEKKKIEILTHTKLQFFTNISHELLTPLTVLSMMVEDLKSKYQNEDKNFNIMSLNIERLIRLFQQILEFRKAETRNLKLKVRHGDIALFVRNNCHSNFYPLIQRKGIHFSVVCTPLQIEGYFDIDKVDKILYNLLSNAIKYTPQQGSVQVTVTTNEIQNRVKIVIHDTGIGIAPDNLPHIFERFYDGEYRKMAVSGHGIGLSLTKELISLHKGEISVSSQLGVGTDFTVQIPINKESFLEYEFEEEIVVDLEASSNPTKQEFKENNNTELLTTILLVDDNEDMLYSLQILMEKSYKVYTANNGLKAFDVLEKTEIELVISDVAMPEFDGISLCEKIKQNISFCHIPVILLTAKSEMQDKISGFDAGADAYITKPFNLLELKAQINSLIKSRLKFFEHFKAGDQLVASKLDYISLDERFLNLAIEYIEKNISTEEIDFDVFASQLNVSRSVLYRKIKQLTSVSPNEFVRKIRLNRACQILREKKVSISEVAFFVGFSNPKYFSTIFRKEFGCTPTEYTLLQNNK